MEEPSAGCGAPAWRRDDARVAPATVRWLLLRRGWRRPPARLPPPGCWGPPCSLPQAVGFVSLFLFPPFVLPGRHRPSRRRPPVLLQSPASCHARGALTRALAPAGSWDGAGVTSAGPGSGGRAGAEAGGCPGAVTERGRVLGQRPRSGRDGSRRLRSSERLERPARSSPQPVRSCPWRRVRRPRRPGPGRCVRRCCFPAAPGLGRPRADSQVSAAPVFAAAAPGMPLGRCCW